MKIYAKFALLILVVEEITESGKAQIMLFNAAIFEEDREVEPMYLVREVWRPLVSWLVDHVLNTPKYWIESNEVKLSNANSLAGYPRKIELSLIISASEIAEVVGNN